MQEKNTYLTDEALEQLIAEAENGNLRQAPDYLERIILRKAEHCAIKESVEIVPIRHVIREGEPLLKATPSKRIQLLVYSAKIMAATAAAIALIIAMPYLQSLDKSDVSSRPVVQQDTEVSHKESRSITRSINRKTSDFCDRLFEKTNELLFQKEEN